MGSVGEVTDLLERPVYFMADVDRVLRLPGGTAKRWIDGYTRSGRYYSPVVRIERTGDEVVTWGEFVEARLLSEFRSASVPILNLRPAVERLRAEFNTKYPLAHQLPLLSTHGRELVRRVQDEEGVDRAVQIVVVRNEQAVLSDQAEEFFRSVAYDQDIAVRLQPTGAIGEVWVDPLMRSGEPVVRGVPTGVLAEMYRAGDPVASLADWYDLGVAQVEAALRYERVPDYAA